MNVFHNFDLDENLITETYKPEGTILHPYFKQRIIDRLKVLKDEIDSEEKEGYKMIVIMWPIDKEEVPLWIQPCEYSEELTVRIQESLNAEYIKAVLKEVSDRFDTFNQ